MFFSNLGWWNHRHWKRKLLQSLLEARSVVSDAVLTDWNQELLAADRAKHVQGSPLARPQRVKRARFWDKRSHSAKNLSNVMPSCKRRVRKHCVLTQRSQKLGQTPAVLRREKARQKRDQVAHSSLLPQAIHQTQRWLPSSERLFLTLLYR